MDQFRQNKYTAGFNTVTDTEDFDPGLTEETVKKLSAIKESLNGLQSLGLKHLHIYKQLKNLIGQK